MTHTTAPTTIEDSYTADGIAIIAGVDEVGRGPLAGPVVACAVILPQGLVIDGVNDSKKISEKRREELAAVIKAQALAYSFGIIDVAEIDEINILQASLLAMRVALEKLRIKPQLALIDGNKLPPNLPCRAQTVTQGDSKSHLIAAASILAKVKRDRIMQALHEEYPQYGFDRHKGYPTAAHRAAVREHGQTIHHRTSFNM